MIVLLYIILLVCEAWGLIFFKNLYLNLYHHLPLPKCLLIFKFLSSLIGQLNKMGLIQTKKKPQKQVEL